MPAFSINNVIGLGWTYSQRGGEENGQVSNHPGTKTFQVEFGSIATCQARASAYVLQRITYVYLMHNSVILFKRDLGLN